LQHRAAVDSKVEAEGIEEDNQKPEPLELPMNEIDALNRVGNTESSGESVAAWVGAAMLFGVGVGYFLGVEKAQEYFAGYLLEQSLSVDNLFVFILIFKFFKVCLSRCYFLPSLLLLLLEPPSLLPPLLATHVRRRCGLRVVALIPRLSRLSKRLFLGMASGQQLC